MRWNHAEPICRPRVDEAMLAEQCCGAALPGLAGALLVTGTIVAGAGGRLRARTIHGSSLGVGCAMAMANTFSAHVPLWLSRTAVRLLLLRCVHAQHTNRAHSCTQTTQSNRARALFHSTTTTPHRRTLADNCRNTALVDGWWWWWRCSSLSLSFALAALVCRVLCVGVRM